MATQNIQLKDGQGNLLMPKTGAEVVDGCIVENINHLAIDNYCLKNSGNIGDTITYEKVSSASWQFIYRYCESGQKFRVTCSGGDSYFAYTFIDADNKITATSGAAAVLTNAIITAPAGTNRLICQNNKTLGQTFNVELVEDLQEEVVKDNSEKNMVAEPFVSEHYNVYINASSLSVVSKTDNRLYFRKYEIDPSKQYYADVYVLPYPNTNSTIVAGVAYLNASNQIIRTELNIRYTSVTGNAYVQMKGVRLTIPPDAKYVMLSGMSVNYSYIALPQLYSIDGIKSANDALSVVNEAFVPVGEFTITGTGNTLKALDWKFPLKEMHRYVITSVPSIWTMPDPSATSSGFAITTHDTPSTTQSSGAVYRTQNEVSLMTEFRCEFTATKNTVDMVPQIRALEGETIRFIVNEIVSEDDYINSFDKKIGAVPSVINYNIATVKSPIYDNNQDTSTEFDFTEIQSAWAAMFPSIYKPNGKPSQVVAMLHGANGGITTTWMGYQSNTNWVNWRNQYLANGFIVLDINGRGLGTDDESHHWGCPIALETLHKAFVYLKENYNVNDKMLIQGSSMGGATAWNYAFTYPTDVKAMALAAPATISWIMLTGRTGIADERTLACNSWMYADVAAAESDNFQKIIGYDPILRCDKYDGNNILQIVDNLVNYDVLSYGGDSDGYKLVGKALPCPVRIWHSPQDITVPVELSKIITKAYRNGGQNVTLRLCPVSSGNGHSICTGSHQYVINEIIQFMQLYT